MSRQATIWILCILSATALAVGQQQTADGGHVIVGTTDSYTHGGVDFLVYKLNASGQKEWRKNFGGENNDHGYSMVQTPDGGYAVAGGGYFGGEEGYDFMVYRLNGAGQKVWRKSYGGEDHDICYCVGLTDDGGYILAGRTNSYAHEPGTYEDMLVYKLDTTGAKQWRKNYGGVMRENGAFIRQTSDGGYILAGYGDSYTHGERDVLVYKLNAAGAKQWRKNYGGLNSDLCNWIQQTSDGGYVLAGRTSSYTNGSNDFLVYKIGSDGTKQWRKNFGGASNDYGYCIRQTSDGGYIVSGYGNSYTNGGLDLLVYKLNAVGQKQWRKNFGGTGAEFGSIIWQTADGGYVLFGDTATYDNGGIDLLCYKLNASGQKQWRNNYGGEGEDYLIPRPM